MGCDPMTEQEAYDSKEWPQWLAAEREKYDALLEAEAFDIGRRAMEGLVRRAEAVHLNDRLIMSPEDCEKALGPLRAILAHIEDAIAAGSGTVEQITERFAAILEPGLIEHVDLQLPTGDMTFDEARRTFELFAAEVKPKLEQASLAA